MRLLNGYETLLALSQQMAGLAQEQAWDALTQTESERRELLAKLPVSELSSLPSDEQQQIATIIKQIQVFDQSVRDYVLPWQDHVRTLLASFAPKA